MADDGKSGRPNQKTRTRKDLLQAASRLMKQGRTPTLEEVAEEALVSRATAYRYFPSVEALLVEAAVDVAVPEPAELFRDDASRDPVARLQRVETALYDMILANEPPLRTMLAHTIQQGMSGRRERQAAAAAEPAHAADRGGARAGARAVQASGARDADAGARADHRAGGHHRRARTSCSSTMPRRAR